MHEDTITEEPTETEETSADDAEELDACAETEDAIRARNAELADETLKPLVIDDEGRIVSGVLWIEGPGPALPESTRLKRLKKRPTPCKHKCPDCGALHADRRANGNGRHT